MRGKDARKMRTIRPATLGALLLTAISAVSCTDSATVNPPATTGTPVGQPLFGFVHRIEAGTLVFDPAEFLTGPEGVAAARAAGVIGPDEDLPNDFYILNEDTTEEREVVIADGARFTLIGFDGSGALADRPVTTEELSELLSGEAESTEFYGFVRGSLPMTLSLGGDAITAGAQQYLP
jgi:hypothetical protein